MRRILLAALILFCSATAGFAANTPSRVFPPDNCNAAEQRVITWKDGTQSTLCATGQDVINLAIPICNDGQVVVRDGGKFICKIIAGGTTPPACASGQFLTFDGTNYGCGSTNVPTCAATQVLTYNGSSFICVAKSVSIPSCAANQFLTYNGTSFQCAATQNLVIPNCPSGQVLTATNGVLTCTDSSTGGVTGVTTATCRYASNGPPCTATCPAGYYRTACSGLATGSDGYYNAAAIPVGNTQCQCNGVYNDGDCYAICAK